MSQSSTTESQPFLPRVGLVWFFVLATLVAVALGMIRAADQGQALAAALVFIVVFVALLALLSGLCFGVAYMFGALEKAVVGNREQVASPFIDGSYPEQIIPARAVDES